MLNDVRSVELRRCEIDRSCCRIKSNFFDINLCSPFLSLSLLSIQYPAQNPNAPEVFYRVIAKNGNGPPVFMDDLLKTLKVPLLLLWGDKDPWIRPQVRATDSQGVVSPQIPDHMTPNPLIYHSLCEMPHW